MLPKLSALQWTLLLAFVSFFGFAVFAVTRDYYLRHPVVAATPGAGAHGALGTDAAQSAALGARMRQALEDGPAASVDLGSDDPVALGEAADQLFMAQQFREAIPVYQRVVELVPDSADARNDLGLALHYSGRSEEGLAVLQEGTDIAPNFQRVWLSLGFVAFQAGQMGIAQQALRRAQALGPDTNIGQEATRLLGLLPDEGG